jgi:hypothetical protein
MELKASYNLSDLVALVRQDLESKGFNLVGEPDNYGHGDFVLTAAVKQHQQQKQPLSTPDLIIAGQPAALLKASQTKASTKFTDAEREENRRAANRKARDKYNEKKKAEKQSMSLPKQEVVAPSLVPFPMSLLESVQ